MQFASYVLPPERVSEEIESLTGIRDSFLREGGVDGSTGVFHGPAPGFGQVYEHFVEWANEKRGGRDVVLMAHNSNFDVGFLDAEVKRLGVELGGGDGLVPPLLSRDAGIVSVVDTLALLRTKKLWAGTGSFARSRGGEGGGEGGREEGAVKRLPRPTSFKQADVYKHVCFAPMPGAHNAMSDVTGLEAILTSETVRREWREIADGIQKGLGGGQ